MIFSLPFHIARFFRPTFLTVFDLSNTGLGDAFAMYGLIAMLVYFPGGVLADKFSARKLMTCALLSTAAGGIYLAQIPNLLGLSLLYGYWGATSILLFWAAMIKATREWGGTSKQGSAFGLLDGGRGLVAAVLSTLAVMLLSHYLSNTIDAVMDNERRNALQYVIYFYSAMTALAGVFIWWAVPDTIHSLPSANQNVLTDLTNVLKKPTIWLQALVVICAYCAYKGLDNFGLYVVDALGMNEVDSAQFTSSIAFLRPLAAISAGFLANRISASRVILGCFSILIATFWALAFWTPIKSNLWIIYANIIVTFAAVYALRGVYFALLEESQTSRERTGAAVGIISLVGFTPDLFFTPLAGRILDASPGIAGHQHFFWLMLAIVIIGVMASAALLWRIKKQTLQLSVGAEASSVRELG
ncbi:MFS transporter [Marinibactrum halimedae]|uniref:MFS transporter n=2 Tax=Marinibactrum halimedae TaxID=1444977 RepID=A0AA37WLD2_9GAMM|nr:MFS transporter [Marinibactrum halimedae]